MASSLLVIVVLLLHNPERGRKLDPIAGYLCLAEGLYYITPKGDGNYLASVPAAHLPIITTT